MSEQATPPTIVGIKRKLSTSASSPSPAVSSPAAAAAAAKGSQEQAAKRRKSSRNNSSGTDAQNDSYCWICHKEGEVICCETCPRVFHIKCIQLDTAPTEDWVCPECVLILTAENMGTRSRAMRLLEVDQLCVLLKHALGRMKTVSGVDPFTKPVDPTEFPSYKDYITCPMDLSTMEKNIKKKRYGSTEAFLAAAKWILHNCIIFNSTASKLTSIAKSLVKVCKHEMQEIENCPDCYLNAHTRKDSWFVAACRIPHLLVWAKLKGFPFWPGKAMRVSSEDNVDVRFFGAHDRAWIPLKDVYLYSQEPPVLMRNKKKGNLDGCVHEVELYIKNIVDRFGGFEFAPAKINYDPKKEEEQIKILYPKCNLPFELGPTLRRGRTYSFSGSERSVTNTPTPSDMDTADETFKDEEEDLDDVEVPEDKDVDDVPPMMTENIVGKEIVDDELMATSEEEVIKETSLPPLQPVDSKKDKPEPKLKRKSTTASAASGDKKEGDSAVVAAEKVHDSDRAAESPPCEVSSTTLTDTEKTSKQIKTPEPSGDKSGDGKTGKKSTSTLTSSDVDASLEKESTGTTTTRTAVIAETSETVVIEGVQDDEDDEEEDEIDDVEEIEEIDDVEPEDQESSAKDLVDQAEVAESEPMQEDTDENQKEIDDDEEAAVEASETLAAATAAAAAAEAAPKEVSNQADVAVVGGDKAVETEQTTLTVAAAATAALVVTDNSKKTTERGDKRPGHAPDEEEIDDVEPGEDEDLVEEIFDEEEEEEVVEPATTATAAAAAAEEQQQQQQQDLDTSRLLASGISVTIIEKSKQKSTDEAATSKETSSSSAPKVATEIALGSDVSVTIVQKKKTTESAESAAARTPKISVKKESELLQDPAREASKAKKTFPGQARAGEGGEGSLATAGSKAPPDPIVTISKVQSMATLASSAGSASTGENRLSQSRSSAPAVPPVVSSPMNIPVSSPLTRTAPYPTAAGLSSLASILGAPRMSGPGFRPGIPQPPPHSLRPGSSGSPLMRIPGGPARGPLTPTGSLNMPSLHPRPPTGPLSFPPPQVPPGAGPVTEQLNKVATKLVDFMRGSLEELFRELSAQGSAEATVKALQLEMEKMQWRHQQELAEAKHNMDLVIMDVRQTLEAEKQKCLSDLKKQLDIEKQKAVAETKKKQWCANCGKEAIFYCCWNTSYCDYPCQQAHWPTHMSSCAQNQSNQDDDSAGPGASSGAGADHMDVMDHSGASHFLQAAPRQANGMMDHTRGMPGAHVGMPFVPQHGLNSRMMNQLGMRFAAAAAQAAQNAAAHQRFPAQLRFPGPYFM